MIDYWMVQIFFSFLIEAELWLFVLINMDNLVAYGVILNLYAVDFVYMLLSVF